jgi:hypothetical protein
MALLFLRSLCRLDEVSFSGSALASYLAHFFTRAFSYTLLLGVDVGIETGLHFLPLAKHLPAALHLAGILQSEHGLNAAAFLPAGLAGAIIIFLPYIIISS